MNSKSERPRERAEKVVFFPLTLLLLLFVTLMLLATDQIRDAVRQMSALARRSRHEQGRPGLQREEMREDGMGQESERRLKQENK